MNRKLRSVLFVTALCLALVALCIPSLGQVLRGSISGSVKDPQGAVVTGAQVKATEAGTGTVHTTSTDSSGLFHFSLIPAGTYKVEITHQGFKTAVQSSIQVTAGSDNNVGAIGMAVGEVGTIVEVTSDAPLIETATSQVTNTFSGTTLATFAGIQENQGLDQLALFVPGVSSVRDNSFSNTNGGAGFSSNGLRGRNNDQEIDGQNNNDNSVAGPALFVSDVEFVQQYVLVTNQFGPEYGRNAGAVVNIITKSGTNTWHGSVYANENNSNLNSLNNSQKQGFVTDPATGLPFTKQPRLNDEFGGFTIGGPLVKSKVFLFGGFNQELISTISPFSTGSITPTPSGLAQLNGCFPASTSLQAFDKVGPYAISGGNPFPTKVQLPGGPGFVNINVGACAGVQFGAVTRELSTPSHAFNFTNRVDWQGTRHALMARYLFNRTNVFNNDFGDAASGYPVNVPALSQALLFGDTFNISSRMVNEARVGFSRLNVDFGGNSLGTVPTADHVDQAVTRVTFNGAGTNFTPIGAATNLPQSRIVNSWQLQDNWNYVVGKHTLKAGVNWTYQRSPNVFLPLIDGSFRFTNWTSFVNNTPNRVQIAAGDPSLDFREYDTFLYAGDDWKISQHLTLNLGLTWTYYGQPANLFNSITQPRESNPATALWATTSSAGTTAGVNRQGQPIPLNGVRDFPTFPAPKNSFGPSIGFAYSPQWGGFLTGNGKTVFRGGYRLLYDPPFYNIYINMSSSAPEVFTQSFTAAQSATKPLPSNPIGPVVRSTYAAFLQKGVFDPRQFTDTSMTPNFGPDKVHSWSFGFEREISKNAAFEARYAGNSGQNLFQSVNGNPDVAGLQSFPSLPAGLIPAGVTACPSANAVVSNAIGRASCDLGILRTRTNGGSSSYNALQTEFRANNLFKQLTIRTAYTWSKTLDNVSEIFSTGAGGNTTTWAQNPFNTSSAERSFSGLDFPHQWTFLVTEEVPFFKDQKGVAGHILGGWVLSGNYIIASGQRYTPVQGFSAFAGQAGNYSDIGFLGAFVGFDTARPFLGSMSAPQTAVGIFAGDACNLFEPNGGPGTPCAVPANELLSMTAMGPNCGRGATDTLGNPISCSVVPVSKNQVRFIINSGEAQSIFGTPFGNMPRNLPQDAISNFANFSITKRFKISERTSFEFRTSLLNVFNHQNFLSVDAFVEDAGQHTGGTGFGDPSVTNSTFVGSNGGTRRINFGGTFRF
jgi:hypothetical protein